MVLDIPQTSVKVFSSACPTCQVPFSLLDQGGQVSARAHVADCQNLPRVTCPDGDTCDANTVGHYQRYSHAGLATHRGRERADASAEVITSTPHTPLESENLLLTPVIKPTKGKKATQISPIQPPGDLDLSREKDLTVNVVASQAPKPYCSPVKAFRRKKSFNTSSETCSVCGNKFQSRELLTNHLCVPRTAVTPAPGVRPSPLIRTERQRKFLQELNQPSKPNVDIVHDDHLSQEDMFKETDEPIEDGRRAIKNNANNDPPQVKNKPAPVSGNVFQEGAEDHVLSLEPTQSPGDNSKPIKITGCHKDSQSQELELSMHIDPGVHCTGLRLKVPLKKTASGRDRPVELSADYTNVVSSPSPGKQSHITEYFGAKKHSDRSEKTAQAKQHWKDMFSNPSSISSKSYVLKPFNSQSSQEGSQEPRKEKTAAKTGRKPPFYKKIQGTNLSVDAFNWGELPGVKYYLLSHFHSDHYIGLSKKWKQRVICSSITKRLVQNKLKVNPDMMTTLDPGETKKYGDCLVTAVEANHCPGAVMFIIKLTSGTTVLHTGDFRASPDMESYPEFWQLDFRVDTLYLDTTYCRPEYDFPSQADVIQKTVELVKEFINKKPKTLVFVGAYDVGKERIFKAILEALDCKLWGDQRRVDTWRCLEDGEILSRLVSDRRRAQVQVINNKFISFPKLGLEYDKIRAGSPWSHVLGVKPTGWSHGRGESAEASLVNIEVVTRGEVSLLEVPYSEHSSFGEMKRFVKFLGIRDHKKIIDTVSGGRCKDTFKQWVNELN